MSKKYKYLSFLAAATFSFCFAACSGSGSNDDGGDCIMCPVGGVRCYYSGIYADICAPDQTLAAIMCSEGGGEWEAVELCPLDPGESGDEGPGAEPWDPGSNVTFHRETGEYVINQQAFEQLKRDPTPLLDDSSHLRQLESGYYEVAKTGDLTSTLGWSTGDVLLELDGYPLQGLDALASVYTELADSTAFELTIRRGRAEVLLRYRVQ